MLSQERQDKIIEILNQKHSIDIRQITRMFGVSHETARRDLVELQNRGIARRVHGGAILEHQEHKPLAPRDASLVTEEKAAYQTEAPDSLDTTLQRIARAAANLIDDGSTLLLGTGSTVLEVANQLKDRSDLTILTNSLLVMNTLIDSDNSLYMIGGQVVGSEQFITGQHAISMLRDFNLDYTIIGCGGITFETGLSDYEHGSADVVREMLQRGRKNILVTGSEKFGRKCFCVTAPVSAIDTIVTDDSLDERYANGIRERGINLVQA